MSLEELLIAEELRDVPMVYIIRIYLLIAKEMEDPDV